MNAMRILTIASLILVTMLADRGQAKDKPKDKPKSVYANRTGDNKAKALKAFGGTEQSEEAVKAGLIWLLKQQMPDGRWKFDGNFPDKGPGSKDIGATGMALLPILAAGYTHKTPRKGEAAVYGIAVQAGLNYILRNQDKRTGHLSSDSYQHGLAAQALCEAYGITKDPALKNQAQASVAYIVTSQHMQGGWRYAPKQEGDLSVSGWYIMALIAAQRAGLVVPVQTMAGATNFVDSCCDMKTEGYAYLGSDNPSPTCTAIGLLCRQHLNGWKADKARLRTAIKNQTKNWALTDRKVADCYQHYYVTQVLFHAGGADWKDWNESMRDRLVKSQADAKDAKGPGSWFDKTDKFGRDGGRLMQTSLNVLMLQSYYRHVPLHGKMPEE
ncbi:MAG: terpene cyclase/mutase family protein [Planctomycetes bacterium]|nr:terpene cyclase/mutase family protein [Planctomycetota bacterium]